MADPNRIWRVGETTWRDTDMPYVAGSDEYYKDVGRRTAKAKGETYQKSDRLKQLEASMAADQLATPEWQKSEGWKEAHDKTAQEYALEQTKYLQGQVQWEKDIADLARQRDQTGKLSADYRQVQDPVLGATYQAVDGYFTGYGKKGGAGNTNPAGPVDNSWNPIEEGVDVRTDEQKYHDRNVKNFRELSDAEGHYQWFGDEEYRDNAGQAQTRELNFDELAKRQRAPESVGPGQGPTAGRGFNPDELWDYNSTGGYGISQAEYYNMVRERQNKSIYGRTA